MSDEAQQADPLDVQARMRALDALPVDGHVEIYDALHRELLDQLVSGADGRDSPADVDARGRPDGADGAPRPGS